MKNTINDSIAIDNGCTYAEAKVNNNVKSKYWLTEEVSDYIFDFLEKQFSECLIMREFGTKVDFFVLDEKLPIEVQATYTTKNNGKESPIPSTFEDRIGRQITQNIEVYDKCWLFFDANLLNYFNNIATKACSINMD